MRCPYNSIIIDLLQYLRYSTISTSDYINSHYIYVDTKARLYAIFNIYAMPDGELMYNTIEVLNEILSNS